MTVSELYWQPVQHEVSRLLSWQDREPASKTLGCFDRTYWGWKFTDFPGARFQEGLYALSHLYTHPYEGNTLIGNERVLTWIEAGLCYWQKIQYRDGSFDEAYPFEHSLAATAFTSFYLGEGVLLMRERLSANHFAQLQKTFMRAGDWLCHHDEYHGVLSNHLAAAAAALQVIASICSDHKYEQRRDYFLERIYAKQSDEGWYEEYGGADPGYQTHTTFYLARVWQHTQDPHLLDSLKRSLAFLKYFIHPNRTIGGEYASRNTEFYFPAGFEILASVIPDAASIAHFMRPAIVAQSVAGVATMDAYNFLPLLNNYLFAAHNAQDNLQIKLLPCEIESDHHFEEAGILIKSTAWYYAIVGLSKGGVLKVFDKHRELLVWSECGYWGKTVRGKTISSQTLQRPMQATYTADGITLNIQFTQINQQVMSSWLFIGFRLFTLIAGRAQSLAYFVKDLLVRILVRQRISVPLQLTRRLTFAPEKILIDDIITRDGRISLQTLQSGRKFSTIHMGSSRYFQTQELELPPDDRRDWAHTLNSSSTVRVETLWQIN